jgi:hypothetical protein
LGTKIQHFSETPPFSTEKMEKSGKSLRERKKSSNFAAQKQIIITNKHLK